MKRPRGFTLIEILVTLFVFSVMLVLFHAVFVGEQLVRLAKDQTLALSVANSKLESLRGTGYDLLPSSGSFSDTQLASLPSGSGTMTVSSFNPTTKQVTVVVTWREPSETTSRTVSLTTLITQTGGLQ